MLRVLGLIGVGSIAISNTILVLEKFAGVLFGFIRGVGVVKVGFVACEQMSAKFQWFRYGG